MSSVFHVLRLPHTSKDTGQTYSNPLALAFFTKIQMKLLENEIMNTSPYYYTSNTEEYVTDFHKII